MRILFLDDCPHRTSIFRSELPFAICHDTVPDIIARLQKETWDVLFLDHDLNGESQVDSNRIDCGMEVVRWMLTNKAPVIKVVVHSHNEDVRDIMVQKLVKAGYDAKSVPFIYLKQSGLLDKIAELHRESLN